MKKLLIGAGVILVLGLAGIWVARPAYRHWKQERLLVQAHEFLQKGELRSAGLSAREVLSVNPANLDACRVMAEITETLHSPLALDWRQRIVDLTPDSLTNRLNLARCAILNGEYARAAKALGGVNKTNQNNVPFHQMAAMVAVGLDNLAAAEAHFAEAGRLDPSNKLVQFDRAVIQLQATNQQVVAHALQSLEQLYADPTYRKDALRHLAMAAMRQQHFDKARAFTQELQADPKAPLDDRVLHLKVLEDGGRPDFGSYLADLEGRCAKEPRHANILTAWLLRQSLADEAAHWLISLPPDMQAKRPVILARADCCAARKDWPGLQALLQGAKWDDLEFLRLAMLARAYREQQEEFTAQTQWRAAVRLASDHPKQLGALARMANQWNWERERDQILWLIVERFPGERWALQSLNQYYLAAGDTRGLYKVYAKLLEYDANNLVAKNNLATVSLLLNLRINKACELAHDAWLKATNNAAFASTYAYSLYLQDRADEGLRVLDALKPSQLETPGVALYYGLMQVSNAPVKARKYLDLAATGQLLPEEKMLLNSARKGL